MSVTLIGWVHPSEPAQVTDVWGQKGWKWIISAVGKGLKAIFRGLLAHSKASPSNIKGYSKELVYTVLSVGLDSSLGCRTNLSYLADRSEKQNKNGNQISALNSPFREALLICVGTPVCLALFEIKVTGNFWAGWGQGLLLWGQRALGGLLSQNSPS